jgi:hypothetical protein
MAAFAAIGVGKAQDFIVQSPASAKCQRQDVIDLDVSGEPHAGGDYRTRQRTGRRALWNDIALPESFAASKRTGVVAPCRPVAEHDRPGGLPDESGRCPVACGECFEKARQMSENPANGGISVL